MTERTHRSARPAAVLIAAAIGTGTLTGIGATVSTAPAFADVPASASDTQTARYEVDFLTGMIDHHAMAVQMAETCVDKAVHPELVDLCESIIASQSAQIEQMQTWLQDWYGISHEPEMTSAQSMQHLTGLEGGDYEVAFMREMTRHHWAAVREAEKCLTNAAHPELISLCHNIYSSQLAQINQMQTWLAEWYDVNYGRPTETA